LPIIGMMFRVIKEWSNAYFLKEVDKLFFKFSRKAGHR